LGEKIGLTRNTFNSSVTLYTCMFYTFLKQLHCIF